MMMMMMMMITCVLHDNVERLLVQEGVVQGDDVWVLQFLEHLRGSTEENQGQKMRPIYCGKGKILDQTLASLHPPQNSQLPPQKNIPSASSITWLEEGSRGLRKNIWGCGDSRRHLNFLHGLGLVLFAEPTHVDFLGHHLQAIGQREAR